jgi:hypothetical protein
MQGVSWRKYGRLCVAVQRYEEAQSHGLAALDAETDEARSALMESELEDHDAFREAMMELREHGDYATADALDAAFLLESALMLIDGVERKLAPDGMDADAASLLLDWACLASFDAVAQDISLWRHATLAHIVDRCMKSAGTGERRKGPGE